MLEWLDGTQSLIRHYSISFVISVVMSPEKGPRQAKLLFLRVSNVCCQTCSILLLRRQWHVLKVKLHGFSNTVNKLEP